jgi:branched-chain amino acid transport system permease protein
MESLIQQIVAGLASGGIYASVALALVMIYTSTEHLNFAQGSMAMFSTYICWSLLQVGIPYWGAFLATLAFSFIGGAFIQLVILRPVANAPVLSVVIVFIGLLVILESMAGWIFSYLIKSFPSPFPEQPLDLGGIPFGYHTLGAIGVTLVILLLLFVFFRYTTLGLAMRAAAHNPVSSRLVGIRVNTMLGLGWGLAGVVGAVAGMMVAPVVFLDPTMMDGILLYAFASALLGGITSPGGAVLGGFIVGIGENLLGAYVPFIGTELKQAVALVLIIGVLLVRPSGFFGKVVVHRV